MALAQQREQEHGDVRADTVLGVLARLLRERHDEFVQQRGDEQHAACRPQPRRRVGLKINTV
jgi:hypothetical protein